MSDTDEELMMSVCAGNLYRLEVLFSRHYEAVHRFFTRMTGDGADADDLAQDVFLRILKYRKSYQAGRPFRVWMFGIARNALNDRYRRTRQAVTEDEFQFQAHAFTPSEQLEIKQRAVLVQSALSRLSPEKREVLVLSRYHDMTYEEIAELMDCEAGTIRVRVCRAIKELRVIVNELLADQRHAM